MWNMWYCPFPSYEMNIWSVFSKVGYRIIIYQNEIPYLLHQVQCQNHRRNYMSVREVSIKHPDDMQIWSGQKDMFTKVGGCYCKVIEKWKETHDKPKCDIIVSSFLITEKRRIFILDS